MISFIKGIIISLVIGVPAGPVGLLTIQNTLRSGFKSGFVTGLGSSVADIFFASIGAFGVQMISDFLAEFQSCVSVIGGILLLLLGIRTLTKKARTFQREDGCEVCAKANVIGFTSALMIAITNPATMLAYLFAFTILNLAGNLTVFEAVMLVSGVLGGTIFWWLSLSALTAKYKDKLKDKSNRQLNIVCGSLMLILAMGVFVKVLIF